MKFSYIRLYVWNSIRLCMKLSSKKWLSRINKILIVWSLCIDKIYVLFKIPIKDLIKKFSFNKKDSDLLDNNINLVLLKTTSNYRLSKKNEFF